MTPAPFYPNYRGSGPTWSHCPASKWPKRVKKGPKGPKMAQNGPQNGLKIGSGRHLGPRDPPIFPTIGVPDPLGAIAPHPNGQKRVKKAQKGQLETIRALDLPAGGIFGYQIFGYQIWPQRGLKAPFAAKFGMDLGVLAVFLGPVCHQMPAA